MLSMSPFFTYLTVSVPAKKNNRTQDMIKFSCFLIIEIHKKYRKFRFEKFRKMRSSLIPYIKLAQRCMQHSEGHQSYLLLPRMIRKQSRKRSTLFFWVCKFLRLSVLYTMLNSQVAIVWWNLLQWSVIASNAI